MKALIIVDAQNDFMPGGALAVERGDSIVKVINEEMKKKYDLVVATQDWHPSNHKSFAVNHKGKDIFEEIQLCGIPQVLWPVHCVQGSKGAELHPDLNINPISAIFRKGMNPEIDSYSAFFDNNRLNNTGLHGFLQDKKVTHLTFCGLAGDFCVLYSVNDAYDLGYKISILDAGIRSINPENYRNQIQIWQEKGIEII